MEWRVSCASLALASVVIATPVLAQPSTSTDSQQHQHLAGTDQGHDETATPMERDGSGTSWLPDVSPMYALHTGRGPWQLMFHENFFVQYLKESGDRGDDQAGSINWVMGM